MRGLSTEVQLCGYYRLESLINYMGTIVIFFLGTRQYIYNYGTYICTRASSDKSVCMDSSALGQSRV